jgi:hypothetical protein
MQQKVVSGFPGVGKSWLHQNLDGLVVADSDSSQFSWQNEAERIRHPKWPSNYIEHIRDTKGNVDVVFVSTHKEVRDGLVQAGIPFALVYPALQMKDEYIARYVNRGNAPAFVELLRKNYEAWIAELAAQQGCEHIVLKPGQHLADVL